MSVTTHPSTLPMRQSKIWEGFMTNLLGNEVAMLLLLYVWPCIYSLVHSCIIVTTLGKKTQQNNVFALMEFLFLRGKQEMKWFQIRANAMIWWKPGALWRPDSGKNVFFFCTEVCSKDWQRKYQFLKMLYKNTWLPENSLYDSAFFQSVVIMHILMVCWSHKCMLFMTLITE